MDVKYEIYMGEGAVNYWNMQLKLWGVVHSSLVFAKIENNALITQKLFGPVQE